MSELLFSLFAGISLTIAALSLYVFLKDRSEHLYFYFMIFSLFSGFYFLFIALSQALNVNLGSVIIASAAVYYSIFTWFIFEYAGIKSKYVQWILLAIFFTAFLFFMINPNREGIGVWQVIAHIGLLGLVICVVVANIELIKKEGIGSYQFLLLSSLFILLALEEIIRTYSGLGLLRKLISFMQPLDLYPLLFISIIGVRMSNDFVKKKRYELEQMKNELRNQELKLLELERLKLKNEIEFKKRDLTDLGIEISRKREYAENIYKKLKSLKTKSKVESNDLDKVIRFTKSQLQIGQSLHHFHDKIDTVNHEFMSGLKKKYPSLTENELHLSALLRLKMNTKQIAVIKGISPDSVKVMRYRLRKKFELRSKDNLTEFLSGF